MTYSLCEPILRFVKFSSRLIPAHHKPIGDVAS
nr:MAG TPA: hypothetical protein [Caudoviricetes sp.]